MVVEATLCSVLPIVYFGADVDTNSKNAEELGKDGKLSKTQLLLSIFDIPLFGRKDICALLPSPWGDAVEGSLRPFH